MSDDTKQSDIELPLSPVEGTDDKFTVSLPDGNRLDLTGAMPADGDEAAFEVRKAPTEPTEHFPGCGLTGPLLAGQHVCALCGGSVRWCGNSAAPFDGRACDRCQQNRVMPRRLKIMKFIELMTKANRTPFDALIARDAVLGELLSGSGYKPSPDEIKAATTAEVVAWDAGLRRAAIRGSDNFDGTPWNARPCGQILLLGDVCVLLANDEEGAAATVVRATGPRSQIQIAHATIRRGQMLSESDGAIWLDKGVPRGQMDVSKGAFWIEIAALQAFMELEIVQREATRLPRQASRSAMRKGAPLPKVIVVRLRRIYTERQTNESEVEWKHRWMVRGHWRRQFYSRTKEHKMIYIAPFIKGPDGAPFLAPRDVVKVVTR